MADDLSVQGVRQDQPSSAGYVGTGAVLGGAAAGIGTHYATKPKYNSYQEIIDSQEPDKFAKEIQDDVKELQEAQKAAEEQFKAEEETFVKENTKTGKEQLDPKFQQAVDDANKNLETAKTNYYNQQVADLTKNNGKALTDAEKDAIRRQILDINARPNANQAKLNTTYNQINEYIRNVGNKPNEVSGLEKLISEHNKKIEELEKTREDLNKQYKSGNAYKPTVQAQQYANKQAIIAENADFVKNLRNFEAEVTVNGKKTKVKLFAGIKHPEKMTADILAAIEDRKAIDEIYKAGLQKQVSEYKKVLSELKPEDLAAELKKRNRKDSTVREYERFNELSKRAEITSEEKYKEKIAELQKAKDTKAIEKLRNERAEYTRIKKSGDFGQRLLNALNAGDEAIVNKNNARVNELKFAQDVQELNRLTGKKGSYSGMFTQVEKDIFGFNADKNHLSLSDKAKVEELEKSINKQLKAMQEEAKAKGKTVKASEIFKKAETETGDLKSIIEQLEKETKAISDGLKSRQEVSRKIGRLRKVLQSWAGEDFQIKGAKGQEILLNKDGKQVRKPIMLRDASGNVIDTRIGQIDVPKAELSANEIAYRNSLEAKLNQKALTKEQIEAQAKEITSQAKFEAQEKALADAKAAMEEAKKGLKDIPGMSEADAKAKFLESKGVKSQAEFVENAVKEKGEAFVEKNKELFEGKIKWNWVRENKKLAIAGAAVAGILAGAGLGKLFAPSREA